MHQVLSYETAVHANSSREVRKYVTKRMCVSLLLTVAFISIMSGYLLGKFITDRQHYLRQLVTNTGNTSSRNYSGNNSIELSSADYRSLKQLRSYQQSKDMLLETARQLSQALQQDNKSNYVPSSLNSEIFNRYISCTQDIPPNTNIESSQFIDELINNTAARQRDCLRIIQMIIDNNLAND